MPKFQKSNGFKMKGFSYPGKSPIKKNGLLDTKLKDVPKKVKNTVTNTFNTIKSKVANATLGDAIAYPITSSPSYKMLKNLGKNLKKSFGKGDAGGKVGGVVGGAEKGLKERGLKATKTFKKKKIQPKKHTQTKKQLKPKAPYKKPVGPRATPVKR